MRRKADLHISRRCILLAPLWAVLGAYMPTYLPITATIVYDNRPFAPNLTTHWGFACYYQIGSRALLFDTGANGATLLANMDQLHIDARAIDTIVISHYHSDHTGGLLAVLPTMTDGRDRLTTVYVPHSFPNDIKLDAGRYAAVVDVNGPVSLGGQVHTTGETGQKIIEQSLVIESPDGLIVTTGCAHSGIVDIVSRARQWGDVAVVMGGFHLKDSPVSDIKHVIDGLRKLGVRRVAPTHCTGETAIRMLADAFGDGYIPAGLGAQISFATSKRPAAGRN